MNTIGIIGAMPSELADIRLALPNSKKESIAGYDFHRTTIGEKLVIHVCCGVGTVNAALCAQLLIDKFGVEGIINTGIAGGMDHKVKVCDVVISSEVLYHDTDPHLLTDYLPYQSVFAADSKMVACAAETCAAQEVVCHTGRIVSGDAFISDNATKADIVTRCSPLAVDMESAGIGHCAFKNGVPFVSVRCISDNADDEGAMSFDTFEQLAAKRVAGLVLAMVEQL